MKKKIALFCVAALVFCLLPGCSADRPEITTDAAETTVIPEETTAADVFDVPGRKDIYFATGNDYYDLYVGYSWVPGPEITLLSREYINPNSIHVSADIQADYDVFVTEQERGEASLVSYEVIESDETRKVNEISREAFALPLYLYQTYAGIEWAEIGRKYADYYEMQKKYEAEEANYDQVTDALDRYNYAATEYIQEYTEINVDDIPVFYEYLIRIHINDAKMEEELTTIHITFGDTVYDLNIGKVYIRPFFEPASGYGGYDYFELKSSSPLWLTCYPYGNGIEECRSEIYCAKESLTLTGLHFLDNSTSNITVLDVKAFISDDPDSGIGINVDWDGITPLYVEQGKYVTLYITVQDDRMKEINYHSKLYPVWEFECDGSAYEIVTEIPLYRYYSDKWLLYAMGMDSLNMESYFNDYFYLKPDETWRNDVDLTPWEQEK